MVMTVKLRNRANALPFTSLLTVNIKEFYLRAVSVAQYMQHAIYVSLLHQTSVWMYFLHFLCITRRSTQGDDVSMLLQLEPDLYFVAAFFWPSRDRCKIRSCGTDAVRVIWIKVLMTSRGSKQTKFLCLKNAATCVRIWSILFEVSSCRHLNNARINSLVHHGIWVGTWRERIC